MNLQTKIPLPSQETKICYKSEVVMLGSCFAENIGARFEYFKFRNLVNPFGILFHPKAIETFLWMALQDERYTDADLFFHNEQWHCFDAHSSLSSPHKDALLERLNSALVASKEKINSATHIGITLGTAWVYRLLALDMIVANCHKIPQREFTKELLAIDEVMQCVQNCIHLVRNQNPSAQLIFTVSPVRHIKDGFVENNQSKSHLIAAIHQAIQKDENSFYFPSYEIMMDELRDYRFYNEDMIHPSDTAVQYIWERFCQSWVAQESIATMKKVAEIQKGIAHRPFNPESKQHVSFLKALELKKSHIQKEFPFISF
ncbi:GSCFA domain-containing protein [Aquimarina sp. D1M17]|uniref:GSCFA domain-containing protein n=1 Tax=Aquimarina acroporae TaxID=2937283 RepID=UPI0020C17E39|nr:GSCFA domain-containing protein [Aquimarina acroporae]MCK8521409.1 GSCFA domain-containing protein [Aquimarina acroporae]